MSQTYRLATPLFPQELLPRKLKTPPSPPQNQPSQLKLPPLVEALQLAVLKEVVQEPLPKLSLQQLLQWSIIKI
jgi:hypothetical protein